MSKNKKQKDKKHISLKKLEDGRISWSTNEFTDLGLLPKWVNSYLSGVSMTLCLISLFLLEFLTNYGFCIYYCIKLVSEINTEIIKKMEIPYDGELSNGVFNPFGAELNFTELL